MGTDGSRSVELDWQRSITIQYGARHYMRMRIPSTELFRLVAQFEMRMRVYV